MENCKPYVMSFLMGGVYCAIGQMFLMMWVAILGPTSPFVMAATLLSMGVIAIIMYIPGIHQKVAAKTGWGSILVFNGFACALGDAYEQAAKKGGFGAGIKALMDLFLWVVGTGALISIIIAVAAFFMA